jgi:hypothetical protein
MPKSPLLGSFECLETRDLPSVWGVPWPDAEHLTLSFAPDGTQTAVGPSTLFSTLNAIAPTATWETEILRAFQTWAVNANINIGVVSDGGEAFGTPGAVQGDSRFGDIRIGAAPTNSTEVANAGPFTWVGSTLGGDVLLNNADTFAIGNVSSAYDLFSVLLHEAGHSLGLGHSDEPGSAMNEDYAFHSGLSAGDIANIQNLYGVPTQDTSSATSSLSGTLSGAGLRYTASGDIASRSDVDSYKFTALPTFNAVTIRLQAKGLSLFVPSVTVYNSAGQVVAAAATQDPLNNDLTLKFNTPLLGGTYTVKVTGATQNVFGMGAYRLTVDTTLLGATLPALAPIVAPIVDTLLNTTIATATTLTAPLTKTDQQFDATYRGTIQSGNETHYYKIHTPEMPTANQTNLNVIVSALDVDPLDPRIHLFDSAGNPVAFQVLSNQLGLISVQLQNVTQGQTYYIEVSARNPGGANDTGNFLLGADFNQDTALSPNWVAGDYLAPSSSDTGTLSVTEGGLYQFFLAASQTTGTGGSVTMTVLDENGNAVETLTATAGQPLVTGVQYLAVGTYTVLYTYSSGTADLRYDMLMLQLSDGVGPYATTTTSPTSPPAGSPPPPPAGTTSPPPVSPPPTTGTSPPPTSTSPPPAGSAPPPSPSTGYTYSGSSTPPPQPNYYSF